MQASTNSLIGESPAFHAAINAARLIAATDVTILVQGESGTGKELIAQTIHAHSRRSGHPLVTINCAALPEALVEAELFGHAKGAFTGADKANPGRIRAAEGGTLFLDEIGELPLAVQAKLLRFLESGEIQGLGEHSPLRVNARIIAATNRDLYTMSQRGEFRQDLYYRLNIVPVQLPALRERDHDVLMLLKHFTQELAGRHGLEAPRYAPSALAALRAHSWPGNVRELRNLAERMLILLAGKEIQRENLPSEFRTVASAKAAEGSFQLPEAGLNLDALERDMISQALGKTQGNRSRAARLLGLTRDTLLYRLKKYALA